MESCEEKEGDEEEKMIRWNHMSNVLPQILSKVLDINMSGNSYLKTNSYTIILKLHKHTKMANLAQFVKIVHLNHSSKQQDVTGASPDAHPSRHMRPHTVWNFRSYL